MKNLLLTFIIALLLAACSTGTQPDKTFKPYKIGDFLLVSPTKAKLQATYPAVRSAANQPTATGGDTVYVTSLDQKGLTVKMRDIHYPYHDTTETYSEIRFVDSTYKNITAGRNLDFSLSQMNGYDKRDFDLVQYGSTTTSHFHQSHFDYVYRCGADLPSNYHMSISYFRKDSTRARAYVFNFTGLKGVLETINNCPK